jgi:malate/lactate dehydrogenase
MTVCDVKPNLAKGFAEDLKHATASLRVDVDIHDCSKDEDVAGADIILISAGVPRPPGVSMSRRELAAANAKIVRDVSVITKSRNPGAKYVVITNPVDAMATICSKFSEADFVIGTGTNLESSRFRSRLAEELKVPVSKIQGWVAGEHGQSLVPLWSTARAYGKPVDEYAASKKIPFDRKEVENYIVDMAEFIVDYVGGTEYGPAAAFRRIINGIVKNTDEVIPVAIPMKFNDVPEPVHVSIPLRLGWTLGPTLYDYLSADEKTRIENAAKAVLQTYQDAFKSLGN